MATATEVHPVVLTTKLADRIAQFLATTRVGVDFGEYAGGLAIVRQNAVLHAEAFLDFHEATLEQRRGLRRGRRSRNAKKLRLARLRSWVLRQNANGERLPDPYKVMRDSRLMPNPGVYKQKGASPQGAASWIAWARAGKGGSEAFVRALTLIFQKRGYKWDAIALGAMNDEQLKDFLLSARVPPGSETLIADLRAQINRRRTDPDHPSRGKAKVTPEEFETLMERAIERGGRPARPRLAEHRSVKEADICAVVKGFGSATGLPAQTVEKWQGQLCSLLNRILRPARFENRLKTGCAWCGKATPRKARVREVAYRAAVHNLRKRDGRRIRPLQCDEMAEYLGWWSAREEAPGIESIKKRLRKMDANQEKMARQLYDLLKDDSPAGRASLCREHLEMAARGLTMKDAGVEWQRIAVRKAPNPCRERRDARVLRRLEELLFHRGKTGAEAWRHGPVAYISLEIPDPDTLQSTKGNIPEKQVRTLKERLAEECGPCLYSFLGACIGETDKDHIFPRSRGGPNVQANLVSACLFHNKEKGNRTPWEWLGASKWPEFEQHLSRLKFADRKTAILKTESAEYPEGDPTALARIGARPRQFIVALGKLFAKYGVARPRADFQLGEPFVQRVDGRETGYFRKSWRQREDGGENFPEKQRATLFNHAEDAAILAAVPPHTWRDHTKVWTADRPNYKGEIKPRPGLVVPHLAPDWAEFLAQRKQPIAKILGNYPVNWRTKFADLTFWRRPEEDSPRLKRFKLLKDLQRKDFKNIISETNRKIVEEIADRAGLGKKGSFAEAVARQMAGPDAKGATVRQAIPAAVERLEKEYPQLRRVQVSSQKGGTLARIDPSDGSSRKVQIKPASEGAIVWQEIAGNKHRKVRIQISIVRPRPLQRFGIPRVDPPIAGGVQVLGQLRRHQVIWLEPPICAVGAYYRVAKLQENGITVAPEESVPAEVLRRIGVRPEKPSGDETDEDGGIIVLGKDDLARFFAQERKD